MKKSLVSLLLLCCCLYAFPQESKPAANPVSDALRAAVQKQSKNLIAAADEMPADKYSFKPTPAQMSFGHLVMHLAYSNAFLCSKISGQPALPKPALTENDPKDKLLDAMHKSFDYCSDVLGKTDDAGLGNTVQLWGDYKPSKAGAMMELSNDLADHYSMAAMYLRLNGMLPPTAKQKD